MKMILITGLLLSLAVPVRSYEFRLVCRTDTQQMVQPNSLGYYTFTLTNTGTERDGYELNCILTRTVPDWSIIYCLKGRCLEPGMPMYDTLEPGQSDTTLEIKVYTSTTPGEAVAILTVRSQGDPTLSRSITTITTLCGGMNEAPPLPVSTPEADTRFIRRHQYLTFDSSAELYSPTGQRLLRLERGADDIRRLPTGVYLLRNGSRLLRILLL
ncbi:MAG: hypothetical protein ABIK38_05415 [candidate division WOR-3 bacterium]